MDLAAALDFARTNHHGVLTTIRTNGRPQLSNVAYHAGDDGTIGISITATRAKYNNLLRVPWAALHVTRPDFYAYAVIEADVEVSPVAAQPDDIDRAEDRKRFQQFLQKLGLRQPANGMATR